MNDQPYSLLFTDRFVKDFEKLSRENQKRVRRALDALCADPYQGRKLKAVDVGRYRWRVGALRIRYDVEGRTIQLLRVTKREDIYRKR